MCWVESKFGGVLVRINLGIIICHFHINLIEVTVVIVKFN